MKDNLWPRFFVTLALLSSVSACGDDDKDGGAFGQPPSAVKETGKIDSELRTVSAGTLTSKNADDAVRGLTSELSDTGSFSSLLEFTDLEGFATEFGGAVAVRGGVRMAPARLARAAVRRARGVGARAARRAADDDDEEEEECATFEESSEGAEKTEILNFDGCEDEEHGGMSGSMTFRGTEDEATGFVDARLFFEDLTFYETDESGLTLSTKANGEGYAYSSGLVRGASSFNRRFDLVLTIDLNVTGPGVSMSGSCWMENHEAESGSSSLVHFETKDAFVCGPPFPSKEISVMKGEALQNPDGTVTLNGTGELAVAGEDEEDPWGAGLTGRVSVELKDVVQDPDSCWEDEPAISGTIILKGTNTATIQVRGCGLYDVTVE